MKGSAQRVGCGAIVASAVAALLSAGCGASSSAAETSRAATAPTTAVGAAPPVPQMVIVTLTDGSAPASDIRVRLGNPAMLMLVDDGAAGHALRASIPVAGLQIGSASAPPAPAASASLIDVHIAVGQEMDVTFTPTRLGSYPMFVDGVFSGTVIVTP